MAASKAKKVRRGRPKGGFTQHRRLDRLRDVLARHNRGMTLYELADALDVSVRTMRRYMQEVSREYELEHVVPRGGGPRLWRIRASEIPRKLELRRTQAYALLAARRLFEPMRGSTLFEEISLAIDRLTALAQRPGRGPNAGIADARLEQRFLYLPHAPKNYQERTEELDDLFQAVSDLRPIRMLYHSVGKPEERVTVHPYAMVLHRDSVYCVGRHVEKDQVRTFVLDRMRNTEASATERFELPEDFDVDQYFQGEFGIWRAPNQRHKVVIEFDAEAVEYIRARTVHPSQRLVGIAGGGVRLTMTVGNLTPVTSWVLEWGERVRVVSPPELVERVTNELKGALAKYNSVADAKPGKRKKRPVKKR